MLLTEIRAMHLREIDRHAGEILNRKTEKEDEDGKETIERN